MLCTLKSLRTLFLLKRTFSQVATSDNLTYCTNIVRQHDYENFLATLLTSKGIRSPALVVRAFNVEVARIQDQTTDGQTAAFRLQFWQDVLTNIFTKDQEIQNIPANPVAQELYKVHATYNLPKRHLVKLVTSRTNLIKNKHFRTLEDIEKYADDTVSSIYFLLLSLAGVTNVNADHAASHLGKAQGLSNILRSINISNHHKMVTLPMDILMKHHISQESVLRGVDDENIRNVVFEVASRANSHLEKARSIKIPSVCHQIFLPATGVDNYLKNLQKKNFNVYDKQLQIRSPLLPFKLYYKRLRNKF